MKSIEILQRDLCAWLAVSGIAYFNQLKATFDRIKIKYEYLNNVVLSSGAFYKVLIPLVQSGVIEYGKDSKGVLFFLPEYAEGENLLEFWQEPGVFHRVFPPIQDNDLSTKALALMKSLPSIQEYVLGMEEVMVGDLSYRMSDYSLKLEYVSEIGNSTMKCGLYKEKDKSFYPWILHTDDNKNRLVEPYSYSFESMFYARCYSRLKNNKQFLIKKDNTLTIKGISFVPPLIVRALLMEYPLCLKNKEFYLDDYCQKFECSSGFLKEAERVFGGFSQ